MHAVTRPEASSCVRGVVVRTGRFGWLELRSFSHWEEEAGNGGEDEHQQKQGSRPCTDKTVFLHIFDGPDLDTFCELLKPGAVLTVSEVVPVRLWNSLSGFTSTPGSVFSIDEPDGPRTPEASSEASGKRTSSMAIEDSLLLDASFRGDTCVIYRIWYLWAANRLDRMMLESGVGMDGSKRRQLISLLLKSVSTSMDMTNFELPTNMDEIRNVSDFVYAMVRGGQDGDWLWGMLPEVMTPRHCLRLAQAIARKLTSGLHPHRAQGSSLLPRNVRDVQPSVLRPCARHSRVADVMYRSCLVGCVIGISIFGCNRVVFDISMPSKSRGGAESTVKVMVVGALDVSETIASISDIDVVALWILAMNVFFLFEVDEYNGYAFENRTSSIAFVARAADVHLQTQRVRGAAERKRTVKVSEIQSPVNFRGIRNLLCLKPSSIFAETPMIVSVKGILVNKEQLLSHSSSSEDVEQSGNDGSSIKRKRSGGKDLPIGAGKCSLLLRDLHRSDAISVFMDVSASSQVTVGCFVALRDCRFIHSKNLKDVYLLFDENKGSKIEFLGAPDDVYTMSRICSESSSSQGAGGLPGGSCCPIRDENLDGMLRSRLEMRNKLMSRFGSAPSSEAVNTSSKDVYLCGHLNAPRVNLYDIVSKEQGDHHGPGDGVTRRVTWAIEGSLSKINFLKAYLRCNCCGSHVEIQRAAETDSKGPLFHGVENTSQFDVIIEYSDMDHHRPSSECVPICGNCGSTDASPAWKLSGFFDDNTAECKVMADDHIALALLGLGSSPTASASPYLHHQGRRVVAVIEQAVRLIGTITVTMGYKLSSDEPDAASADIQDDEAESADEFETGELNIRRKAGRRDLSRMVAQYLAIRGGIYADQDNDVTRTIQRGDADRALVKPSAAAMLRYCQLEMQKMMKNANLSVIHALTVRWTHTGSFNGVRRQNIEARTIKIQRADQPEFMMECVEVRSNYYRKYAMQVIDHRVVSDAQLRAACWDLVAELE